jgi:hypothetical protein
MEDSNKDINEILVQLLDQAKRRDDKVATDSLKEILEESKVGPLHKYCQLQFWRPFDSMMVPGTNIRVTCCSKKAGELALFDSDEKNVVYLVNPIRGSVPDMILEQKKILAPMSKINENDFSHWMLGLFNGIFEEVKYITIIRDAKEVAILASTYPLMAVQNHKNESEVIGDVDFGEHGNYGSNLSVFIKEGLAFLKVENHVNGGTHAEINIHVSDHDKLEELSNVFRKAANAVKVKESGNEIV